MSLRKLKWFTVIDFYNKIRIERHFENQFSGQVLVITSLVILTKHQCEAGVVQELLRTVVQGGLAGFPIVHQEQTFDFDPEISQKRRSLYYEVNH